MQRGEKYTHVQQLHETKATTAVNNMGRFDERMPDNWSEIAAFVVAPFNRIPYTTAVFFFGWQYTRR